MTIGLVLKPKAKPILYQGIERSVRLYKYFYLSNCSTEVLSPSLSRMDVYSSGHVTILLETPGRLNSCTNSTM